MSTVGKNSQRLEQDLVKKRQAELRHAKDIRQAYERKLEKVSDLLQQLQMREQEWVEREKIFLQPGYVKNQRKFAASVKKAQDRFYRKLNQQQVQQAAAPSNVGPLENGVAIEVTLDSSDRPRTVVKKLRHKRVGSGTISSPKASPSRERRYQSEPRSRLVDSETQTNSDDLEVMPEPLTGDQVDHHEENRLQGSIPDLLDDQMVSSSDQLELRESSDEDHLEKLGRQVSELSERFSLGNSSFKRAFVTAEPRNGEVIILRAKSRSTNSEGDESWTDEEGESQSDTNYSLRRKR